MRKIELTPKKIKVLVVDDSAMVRSILTQGLSMDPEIEVVGSAANPYIARDKIVELKPDVLTLDVEMPRMDGVEFLRKLMPQYPLPVLMVSSLTERGKEITMQALEAGAVDFVTKPSTNLAQGLNSMLSDLRTKVKIVSTANVSSWKNKKIIKPKITRDVGRSLSTSNKILAIGASTGGTEAIKKIMCQFPANMIGTVIVQHMPAGFTAMFAKSLDNQCEMTVKEAESGDLIIPGRVLIAPGDYHTAVRPSGNSYIVECEKGEKVCGHRPSVEVLFRSVAKHIGKNAIGVMLTGMGHDGADGMIAMRTAGAETLAQNEETSVVFGMPRAAYERGGTTRLVALESIPGKVTDLLTENN